MNKMQKQVEDFRRAMEQSVARAPGILYIHAELCARLIEEEAKELCVALREGRIVDSIDGICDLLYVTFGAAVAVGVDVEPFFDEVHRTNMLKTTGPVRDDGKRLKPDGWKPPAIATMLALIVGVHPDKQKEVLSALAPNT